MAQSRDGRVLLSAIDLFLPYFQVVHFKVFLRRDIFYRFIFSNTIYNYIYIVIKILRMSFRPDKLCNLMISFISSSLDSIKTTLIVLDTVYRWCYHIKNAKCAFGKKILQLSFVLNRKINVSSSAALSTC